MAPFGELQEATLGLGDKAIGLAREAFGTLLGRDHLADAGRAQQDRGSDRLDAIRHEARADAARTRAALDERRQRASQGSEKVSGKGGGEFSRTGTREAVSGVAEQAKGKAKEAVGALTGDDRVRREARAQQSKGEARTTAAREEAKGEEARAEARAADLRTRAAEQRRP